eukprot:358392-Chlamydomonas_euryale.AAC.4
METARPGKQCISGPTDDQSTRPKRKDEERLSASHLPLVGGLHACGPCMQHLHAYVGMGIAA